MSNQMDFPLGKFPRNPEEMCSYWFYEAKRKETNQKWDGVPDLLTMSRPYLGVRRRSTQTSLHLPPPRGLLTPYSTNGKCTDLCILCSWGLTLERRRLLRSSEGSGCLLFSRPIIVSQSYWGVSEAKSNGVDLNQSEKLRREKATASTGIGLTRWWHKWGSVGGSSIRRRRRGRKAV
jgi:hypothetical protein